MLIPLHDLVQKYGLKITGVLHVGAHAGEENDAYLREGVPQSSIYWVEAIPELCTELAKRLPNVIQAVVSDRVENVEFKITNNFQSSSILELKEHLNEHPGIDVVKRVWTTTSTLDSVVKVNSVKANFLNMDIQGAELKCLQGFEEGINAIDYVYAEVNTKELYAGCALLDQLDEWLGIRGFQRKEIAMTPHGWGDALYVKKPITS
jgi:FkbM family methyltransferase